jgi:hypothetical protein
VSNEDARAERAKWQTRGVGAAADAEAASTRIESHHLSHRVHLLSARSSGALGDGRNGGVRAGAGSGGGGEGGGAAGGGGGRQGGRRARPSEAVLALGEERQERARHGRQRLLVLVDAAHAAARARTERTRTMNIEHRTLNNEQ